MVSTEVGTQDRRKTRTVVSDSDGWGIDHGTRSGTETTAVVAIGTLDDCAGRQSGNGQLFGQIL